MSITMADDFDSDSGVGFKRSISDISDDSSDNQLPTTSFEESPPLSPPSHQLQLISPLIGKEGIGTVPHSSDCTNLQQSFDCLQKKPKCSNNQESVESDFTQGVVEVKEKLGFDEDDSGYDDVPMNLLNDVDDVAGFSTSVVQSPPLLDDGNQNNGCFSGKIEESSGGEVNNNNQVQMDFAAVEDSSNKGLVAQESSISSYFVQNLVSEIPFQIKKEQNEESISDSNNDKSYIVESFADENLGAIEGKHKKFVNENLGHNDSQRARGGRDVKCALKIQVIDDTALIGSVSALPPPSRPRVVVNNHMERNVGNNKKNNNNNQETVVGYEKKLRRRGKGLKKCLETSGNDKVDFTQKMVGPQKGREKKADDAQEEGQKKRWAYSRKEMEALRFVNVEGQKKKWVEIYCGFGPSVTKEYDGLVDCNQQKHIRVNFDPRPLLKKKDAGPPILSDEYCENMDNEIQNMDSVLDGDTVVQEALSEDDSDDEEYNSIQRPAFLVTGKPDFDSGPPQDGLEYLRRVRWEAEHIPKVKVAKVERSKLNKEQTIYMPNIPDIAKCPDHLLPLKQWEDAFLADFSELRLALSRYEASSTTVSAEPQSLPTLVHEQECPNLILDNIVIEKFENLTTHEVDSSSQSLAMNEMDDSLSLSSPKSSIGDCGPTLTTILGMDSVARVSMLRKRINSVETMSCLSRSDCVWLFALCAAVDTPLNADTCASLRCLLRKCASLRAQKVEMDDEVVMLNILGTISGKYFGQSEK